MKLTYEERNRIRRWLDKDPAGPDKGKTMELNGVTLSRDTLYTGTERNWKVRVAYVVETGYPVAMSAPIPGNLESKKQLMKNGKPVMVEKFPPIEPKSTFDDVVQAELATLKLKMKEELSKPNLIWSMFEPSLSGSDDDYDDDEMMCSDCDYEYVNCVCDDF